MQQRLNQFMLLLMVAAVVMTSAIGTTTVYADDGTTEGSSEETPVVDETTGTEPAPVEESTPTELVQEIIAQIPDGTELIVVGETGVEPLASEEAAQILIIGDPIWCPDGATPSDGANGCTTSFATFDELLTALVTDNGVTYNGDGVIWVAGSYANADDSPVIFDGSSLSWLNNLEFMGGWSGTNGDNTVNNADYSDLDVSLSVVNWSGNVTLSNLNIDAEDSFAALLVETSGNITLNNIISSGNSLGYGAGLDTCVYDAGLQQCTGIGNVDVQDSVFDSNAGSGIGIDSGGTVNFDNVQANGNNYAGTEIYNYDLLGAGGVQISNSTFDSNGDNGIWVDSDGAITLTNTDATDNGFDGADLLNYLGSGDITVNGGDFSGNDGAGLYIASNGNVFISNVVSNNNTDGADIDNTYGNWDINVTNSTFDNNLWTGLYAISAGNITLDNVGASFNSIIGAYLDNMSGDGDINIINGSAFNENGDWGLKAFAGAGSITLTDVLVDGNNISENGAWVKSYGGGDVWVENSVFTGNANLGLLAIAGGQVDLVNVTVTSNGGNGVEAYSIYTFACFGSENILVNVDSGVYSDNGGYGIYTEPGTTGSLALVNSPVFSGNGLGDTFVEQIKNPCPPKEEHSSEDEKPSNVVLIPEDGGEPVLQDCENFSSTTLQLHTGTSVKVGCPFTGSSQLADTTQDELPGRLPAGLEFGSAITIGLDDEGNPILVMTEGGLLTITFIIPEELMGKRLSILYWDPTANDGQGDWVELPLEQYGGASFPLYPENPEDGRLICSGFEQSGNTVSVTVNFPGVFVLVAR